MVVRRFAAHVSLSYGEKMPADDFIAILARILLSVVDISILVLYFGKEDTSRSSLFMIPTSVAELLSHLFH